MRRCTLSDVNLNKFSNRDIGKIPFFYYFFLYICFVILIHNFNFTDSSISSQLNSLGAMLWEDFCKNTEPFNDWSEGAVTKFQKILGKILLQVGMDARVYRLESLTEATSRLFDEKICTYEIF